MTGAALVIFVLMCASTFFFAVAALVAGYDFILGLIRENRFSLFRLLVFIFGLVSAGFFLAEIFSRIGNIH